MLVVRRVRKKEIPQLVQYKLVVMAPYMKNEDLEVTKNVNNYFEENYKWGRFIYYNFKLIGAFFIKDSVLELIYVERKYRYLGIGTKILKRNNKYIDAIKFCKGNEKAVRFFKKNDYEIWKKDNLYVYMKRVDLDDN
ncbi:MAG: GNAT family N-acetyltransferase [Bacilli bacterium]|jgi:GNAT superfamily N-acetyltransferase|nr:GNAT family N-acetyltransferase [Bacilli bacterium]